jgi:hypothetical protein
MERKIEKQNNIAVAKRIGKIKEEKVPMKFKTKAIHKYNSAFEKYIIKNKLKYALEVVRLASEDGVSDSSFYMGALEHIKKRYPTQRGYLAAEDIAQSAAMAGVTDVKIYKDAIDYILTPNVSPFDIKYLTDSYIESACRVLASISIANAKLKEPIRAGPAFQLALDRISSTIIENERRHEVKINRMVEIFEQALEARVDPAITREMYEKVYMYVKSEPELDDKYKIKTLEEITTKAIKAPGLSHTHLFIDFINYAKEYEQYNLVRNINELLQIYKK